MLTNKIFKIIFAVAVAAAFVSCSKGGDEPENTPTPTPTPDKKAPYMGYSFLYGVIGSSIGSFLGAGLYVKIVEQMHQPQLLWLIFTGIGVLSIVGLLIYNKIVKR